MAIFGNIELENLVQTNDKTRINCTKTFLSKDEPLITLCRIKPEASGSFIEVGTNAIKDFYLDWQYETDGVKTVTLELTNIVAMTPVITTFTKDIVVVLPEDDKLLSSDQDLISLEPDILKWVPQGKNTFLNVHREALRDILDWLDSIRIWRTDGTKLTKEDLSYTDDLKQLSIYTTLSIIFFSISNKVDDVFLAKAKSYKSKALDVQNRGRIQADFNGNGTLESSENTDMRSFNMVRR